MSYSQGHSGEVFVLEPHLIANILLSAGDCVVIQVSVNHAPCCIPVLLGYLYSTGNMVYMVSLVDVIMNW